MRRGNLKTAIAAYTSQNVRNIAVIQDKKIALLDKVGDEILSLESAMSRAEQKLFQEVKRGDADFANQVIDSFEVEEFNIGELNSHLVDLLAAKSGRKIYPVTWAFKKPKYVTVENRF